MKRSELPEPLPKTGPMYCVLDMRSGELICNLEAADSAEAVRRAFSVAGLLGKSVAKEDLAAAPVDEAVCVVPTFNEAFFSQGTLLGFPPDGSSLH